MLTWRKTALNTVTNVCRGDGYAKMAHNLLRKSERHFGLRSIGKSGFRICNRTRNAKTDFTSEKSVLRVDFNWEIQLRISWISFLPFDWEIRKRIRKTVLVNCGLRFASYACACKTAVPKDSFSNPFFGFPNRTVLPRPPSITSRLLLIRPPPNICRIMCLSFPLSDCIT